MARIDGIVSNAKTPPDADIYVHGTASCNLPNHTFTLQPAGPILTPALDLVPGRRCICGYLVIIDHPGPALPRTLMLTAPIDSAAATKFALDHPSLKKW